jgi:hypothetical protein
VKHLRLAGLATAAILLAGCGAGGGAQVAEPTAPPVAPGTATAAPPAAPPVATGAPAAPPAQTPWVPVVDQPTGVTVELPQAAQVQNLEAPNPAGGSIPFRAYTNELANNAGALTFAVTEIPAGAAPLSPQERLDGAVQGAAANVGATVESQVPATMAGADAADAVLTFTQGGISGVSLMRVAVVGDRYVMQLQTIGPDTNRVELQTLHDRMIGSTVIP